MFVEVGRRATPIVSAMSASMSASRRHSMIPPTTDCTMHDVEQDNAGQDLHGGATENRIGTKSIASEIAKDG
jgi:hypothetical protein